VDQLGGSRREVDNAIFLAPFFHAWGVPVSDKARAAVAELPPWMPEGFPPE